MKHKVTANVLTKPMWTNVPLGGDNILPGGVAVDASQFPADGTFVITTVGNAAMGATSITVLGSSMTGVIPNGTRFDFGGGVTAVVTATARPKDDGSNVTVSVAALAATVNASSTATVYGTGAVRILSGTVVGRTYAERDAGTPFGVPADSDDEVYIIWHDVVNALEDNWVGLLAPGAFVWENKLPTFSALSTALKAKIRAQYTTGIK